MEYHAQMLHWRWKPSGGIHCRLTKNKTCTEFHEKESETCEAAILQHYIVSLKEYDKHMEEGRGEFGKMVEEIPQLSMSHRLYWKVTQLKIKVRSQYKYLSIQPKAVELSFAACSIVLLSLRKLFNLTLAKLG